MTYIRMIDDGDVPAAKFITDWLEANGCRHMLAVGPIIVRGNIIEYRALCRADPKSIRRWMRAGAPVDRPRVKRIRQRVMLHAGMGRS